MSFIVVISLSVASYKMNSLVFIFNTVPFYKKMAVADDGKSF